MKSAFLMAALMVGSTAVAHAAQPSGRTVADPSQSSGARGVTQQGTDPEGQACTPAGFNQTTSAYPPCGGAPTTSPAAGGTPPPCSRTVTDGCVQTYERGMGTGRTPRR